MLFRSKYNLSTIGTTDKRTLYNIAANIKSNYKVYKAGAWLIVVLLAGQILTVLFQGLELSLSRRYKSKNIHRLIHRDCGYINS